MLRGLTLHTDANQSSKGNTLNTEEGKDCICGTDDVLINAPKLGAAVAPQHHAITADPDRLIMGEWEAQSGKNHFSFATALRVLANERKRGW